MLLLFFLLSLCFTMFSAARAANGGSFSGGGNTLISAMMMFVGNEEKVYILDKAEGNKVQINGHPAWGAIWDIASHQATPMDVRSNSFCSSGMHLPNGSYITFGGSGAVGPGGNLGSQLNPGGFSGAWDSQYQDFDGTRAMRILNPCTNANDFTSPNCQWLDNPTLLSMKSTRWYSSAEATGDGNVVIIGGFASGGYVNRNYPNIDPVMEGNGSNPTYEYYPPRVATPRIFQFLVTTSGLNAYVHTFLMPSGKMFVQANISTVLWDHENNIETPLPNMPRGIVRVYPASGATAMLPLTPANNYTPTIIFCGGSDMPEYSYGDYRFPYAETWNIPTSQDCQRITPEPKDGSAPAYEQDDNMLEGRTMGQFIILPDGKLLVVNGALNGTAGYSSNGTLVTPPAQMPFGQSLASGPVGTPAIYDPTAPRGSRWSNEGFSNSPIPRLYHSSAILLPDASVLIAGSNPNADVNTSAFFPTTYEAEIFYPPYFSATTRPAPTGMPKTLTYGGSPFNITIPATSYAGSSDHAADATTVVLMRGGFTTHAMNMGQRHLQLNSTSTVNDDGSITLHVAQVPPNPNIFQPGPAFIFVNIRGIPSNGSYLIVGNGQIGTQPTSPASVLPDNVRVASATGSAWTTGANDATGTGGTKKTSLGLIIGPIAGGLALIVLVWTIISVRLARRRAAARLVPPSSYSTELPGPDMLSAPVMIVPQEMRLAHSGGFSPLALNIESDAWILNAVNFAEPYTGGSRTSSYHTTHSNASSFFFPEADRPVYAGPQHRF